MSEDDSFLGRWSRRKRATETPAPVPPVAPAPPLADPQPPDPAPLSETLSEAELAALPRIEDLTEGSDITAFLRPGVPRALKNAARRQVWMATPAIRDYRDPAVDYAWDWNTPGGVPGDGCAPSPERAARMLRDLLAPRAPSSGGEPALPGSAPDTPSPADDPMLAQAEGGAGPAAEDAPAGPADPVPAAACRTGDTPVHTARGAEASVPRRRHGGALPG